MGFLGRRCENRDIKVATWGRGVEWGAVVVGFAEWV